MITIHEDYIVDEDGKKKAVVVPVAEWEQVLDALEELEAIRAYDEAKSHPSEPIPFEQAVREIREGESS
jgi:PHD/YefM family antitoxin component YafN of YafNO toxin-antitoxin module